MYYFNFLSLSKDGSSVVRETMDQMTARIGGDGGAIAIDTKGKVMHLKYYKHLKRIKIYIPILFNFIQVKSGLNLDKIMIKSG